MSFFEILRKYSTFQWNVDYVSDDEFKIISSSASRAKRFILDLIYVFVHRWNILYFIWKFEKISFLLSTKFIEKWSQNDFY